MITRSMRASWAAGIAGLLVAGACSAPLPLSLPGALGASASDVPPARTATGRLEIRAESGAVVTVTQGLGGDSASEAQLEAAYQSGFDEGRDSARPGSAGFGNGTYADDPDCDCVDDTQAVGETSTKEPAAYTRGWNQGYSRGYDDGYDGVVGGGAAPEDQSETYRRGWDDGYSRGYDDGQEDAGRPDCTSGKCLQP